MFMGGIAQAGHLNCSQRLDENSRQVSHLVCLFERLLEIQKDGIFLFEISFFVSEILTFFFILLTDSVATR